MSDRGASVQATGSHVLPMFVYIIIAIGLTPGPVHGIPTVRRCDGVFPERMLILLINQDHIVGVAVIIKGVGQVGLHCCST